MEKLIEENEKLKYELEQYTNMELEPSMMGVIDKLNDEYSALEKERDFYKRKYNNVIGLIPKVYSKETWVDTLTEWLDYDVFENIEELKEYMDVVFPDVKLLVYNIHDLLSIEFDHDTPIDEDFWDALVEKDFVPTHFDENPDLDGEPFIKAYE